MAELLKFVVAVDEWIAHHSNRNDLDSTDQFICCTCLLVGSLDRLKVPTLYFSLGQILVILFRFSEIRCVYVIMINYDHVYLHTHDIARFCDFFVGNSNNSFICSSVLLRASKGV